jgi:folate-dependent phosphoribosylglycinamide formyltransferase PurN
MLEIRFPLLGYCPIINVHPADMRIKNTKGKTKYTGDDAVTLAINAGEKYTASTIHVVEEELDNGRIICVSAPLPVGKNVLPWEHQEKMKIFCDGPAYQEALRMICEREFVF